MFSLEVAYWAAAECERQQSGEMSVARMLNAYEYAHQALVDYPDDLYIGHTFIMGIGARVDNRNVNFRTVPVHFAGGGFAINTGSIHQALNSLYNAWNDERITVDEFCKEFLDIHPFIDGNGRTTAILYNVLNGTLDNPITFPDYYAKD